MSVNPEGAPHPDSATVAALSRLAACDKAIGESVAADSMTALLAAAVEMKGHRHAAQRKQASLEAGLRAVQAELAGARAELSRAQARLTDAGEQLADARAELARTRADLDRSKAQLALLTSHLEVRVRQAVGRAARRMSARWSR
jgi:chromosome segregation ATPase